MVLAPTGVAALTLKAKTYTRHFPFQYVKQTSSLKKNL